MAVGGGDGCDDSVEGLGEGYVCGLGEGGGRAGITGSGGGHGQEREEESSGDGGELHGDGLGSEGSVEVVKTFVIVAWKGLRQQESTRE